MDRVVHLQGPGQVQDAQDASQVGAGTGQPQPAAPAGRVPALLHVVIDGLEKQAWMLSAENRHD